MERLSTEGPRNAKADGVLPFFERAGQRHAPLKRVAQTPSCRLLFTAGVQHIFCSSCAAVWNISRDYPGILIVLIYFRSGMGSWDSKVGLIL